VDQTIKQKDVTYITCTHKSLGAICATKKVSTYGLATLWGDGNYEVAELQGELQQEVGQ
jgi:hypothetical protein